jgi:hypothetical protein
MKMNSELPNTVEMFHAKTIGFLNLSVFGLLCFFVFFGWSDEASAEMVIDSCEKSFRFSRHESSVKSFGSASSGYDGQPAIFQVMVRRFEGGLDGITSQLPAIGKFSDVLLLSGLHPQTVGSMPNGNNGTTHNYFGYWPSDHGSINPAFGTLASLRALVDRAKQHGIRVTVDAVPAHFGYEGADTLYSFSGKNYPKLSDLPSEAFRSSDEVQGRDWSDLSSANSPDEILRLWDKVFATKRLFGLPGFNHRNELAREYLINSYKNFIDVGVTGFRIDAALYVDRYFLSDFINQLSAYSNSKGRSLHFYVELLVHHDVALKVIAEDVLSRVQNKEEVFYLDFPLMDELRRAIDPGAYKLEWLKGFYEYRQKIKVDRLQLIPTLVNHDFGYPFNAPSRESTLYAIYSFLDGRSALILGGTENTSAFKSTESVLSSVDGNGAMGILNSRLANYLKHFQGNKVGNSSPSPARIETVDGNSRRIVMSRRHGTKSLLLFAGVDAPGIFSYSVRHGARFNKILSSPNAQTSVGEAKNDGNITISFGDADFILFEVDHGSL